MSATTSCKLSLIFRRLVFFCSIWLVLSKADLSSWPFALPTVLISTWISLCLGGPEGHLLKPVVLLRYLPLFVLQSIASAFDVMVRVLNPSLPIHPGLVHYPLSLTHDGAKVLLANCITMLPGTISAQLNDDHLIVHTLDTSLPVHAIINRLERKIANIFRLEITSGQKEFQP
ncbi:MAG: Na+/H+ antiporter subunit E [Desulfobulbaceae bacterium]|nr:Na+/H+ antiporter subunit E [Desulfobulbaceae bacterium]